VLPNNDLKEHVEECTYPVNGLPYCECSCNPVYLKEGEDGFLVIHNSFDGRENFELNNKKSLN